MEEFKARSNTVKTKAIDINLSDKVVNSSFGVETKRDQLIVMDNVSGLADESKNVYLFHTIYPENANWKILSQTNIFNDFPVSVLLVVESTFYNSPFGLADLLLN